MRITVESYILLFFAAAVLGWAMEVACKSVQFKRFMNRGFLIGPYCPIYGVGAVLIALLLSRHRDAPLAVFVLAMALCATLEYLTSFAMEKLFHARWWDYSNRRFNLNGRVCAGTLLPFGLLALLLVYVIQPWLFGLFAAMAPSLRTGLCALLAGLLVIDTVISARVLGKIRTTSARERADNTEALTRAVRETLSRQGVLMRRTLRAFPYAKLYNSHLTRQLQARKQKLKAESQAQKERMKAEFNRLEEKVRAELKQRKEQARRKG